MVDDIERSNSKPRKRGAGRPVSGENDVGRERLLDITEELLRTLPPARITRARIAQEANVDPALVRYYFGDRAALFVAVIDRVTAHSVHSTKRKDEPVVALSDHIGKTVQFVRSATFMHRLMIDELAQSGTAKSLSHIRKLNLDLVEFYREILRVDGGNQLKSVDPLLLHLVVLGASDFFSSAEPLIKTLVPEGTDMEKLSADFQEFLTSLVLDGLRRR